MELNINTHWITLRTSKDDNKRALETVYIEKVLGLLKSGDTARVIRQDVIGSNGRIECLRIVRKED